VKQNRSTSIATTLHRLRSFFPERSIEVREHDRSSCQRLYTRLASTAKPDTHRNTLAEARTFFKWCVKTGKTSANPLDGVEGVGRRRKGKPQLRIDEARRWLAEGEKLAVREAGAVAAMASLLMGLRASEIITREVRDLDDDGRLLWIPSAKTEAGRRTVEVPDVLRPCLVRLAKGRGRSERLFGEHWRDWVRKWVRRICRAAGVPLVSAHSMRGLHSSLAIQRGVTAHEVARTLGHASPNVTREHYATVEAQESDVQRRALTVLRGGRK
jgi:integrase